MSDSKRMKELNSKVSDELMLVSDAVDLLLGLRSTKFDESVDICIRLGLDSTKSNQNIKANYSLPHGLGKKVKIAVFAVGDEAEAAVKAGADRVGYEDLAEDMKKGELDYNVVIATQQSMPLVGKLGTTLGPKGLMPNLKLGTVTTNVAAAVEAAKAGQFTIKNDKSGQVHGSVGRSSFDKNVLVENIKALVDEIRRIKPPTSKGIYLKTVALSLTMSPSLKLDVHKI
jgi:large subunit ribosomal protein L1